MSIEVGRLSSQKRLREEGRRSKIEGGGWGIALVRSIQEIPARRLNAEREAKYKSRVVSRAGGSLDVGSRTQQRTCHRQEPVAEGRDCGLEQVEAKEQPCRKSRPSRVNMSGAVRCMCRIALPMMEEMRVVCLDRHVRGCSSMVVVMFVESFDASQKRLGNQRKLRLGGM